MANSPPSDDEYEIPLRDQRYFGAGIKRKRIQFVPSISSDKRTPSLPAKPAASVADTYLSIVLKKHPEVQATVRAAGDPPTRHHATAACSICKQSMVDAGHESSLAHQICLAHSHPPSHIDRTRKGLAFLETHGWNPDSRKGLGVAGSEGRLYPIRATENPKRAGLGADFVTAKKVEKIEKLDAGKSRQLDTDAKRKAQDLRNAFYRSEEVERYLGKDQINVALDLDAFKRAKQRG